MLRLTNDVRRDILAHQASSGEPCSPGIGALSVAICLCKGKAVDCAPPAGSGRPCSAGVNLQWAARASGNQVLARVFERGEGPTASSGTSASAVACAAWRAGWVGAGEVAVVMPGGTAPVRLQVEDGTLSSVSLFGTAYPQA